jgi:cell wall-associated NlpC family hydrolase
MKLKIIQEVVDLRAEPQQLLPLDFSHNPLRLSQLALNEEVELVRQEGDWLYIRALEQHRFSTTEGWHFYPGWIHASEATTSNQSRIFNCQEIDREKLVSYAKTHLGHPYLWGGTTHYREGVIASVDCSGLTYLAYKDQGKLIPRNAHDQYLRSEKISKSNLLPGDLIFWEPKDKLGRITHVTLYVDERSYLEAPESGQKVRILPLPVDFWRKEENSFQFPERTKTYNTYFGRVI